ncbi:flavodoxin domain-containing protein [Mesobacillus maritimus]|uniref:Flavodoxin domain-containing protein n=1 Tax=Mesobacillus maritimus TaxID=1643336 RepID=A0ABS7K8G1_9BACI|nr:flavodoxin domain-containing protein [Mesobacillus maritimus]MBY0098515.1 flavodoxin domain-containing protein [Mesobacillus maritimus]
MKVAIVYASITGNTKELAEVLFKILKMQPVESTIYKIEEFPLSHLCQFDAVAIGTYTWGNGELPTEMEGLYQAFELLGREKLVTAVFGTGDSFYPRYCGAVDLFRDMLYVNTNLAAILKVELTPQVQDVVRCQRLVESMLNRVNNVNKRMKEGMETVR